MTDQCDLLKAGPNRIPLYKDFSDKEYKGWVELLDVMPRLVPKGRTGDVAIVQGARISYGSIDLRTYSADESLIRYLVEHYHTSPLELASLKFWICCPLYVFNQLVRHRTAQLNCTSYRYKKATPDFYVAPPRMQDTVNKQGSTDEEIDPLQICEYTHLYECGIAQHAKYKNLVEKGIAKEIARGALPQNIMTTFVWKCDLHNFLKMIRLRTHPTAQKEIRELADAMFELAQPRFPITCGAVRDYWFESISLAKDEVELLRKLIAEGETQELSSTRRQKLFEQKIKALGL